MYHTPVVEISETSEAISPVLGVFEQNSMRGVQRAYSSCIEVFGKKVTEFQTFENLRIEK